MSHGMGEINTYTLKSHSWLLNNVFSTKFLANTFFLPLGIAKAGNMTVSDVVLFNIFYELFTFCTSIVAEDGNGKLFHVRNLDFGIFMG